MLGVFPHRSQLGECASSSANKIFKSSMYERLSVCELSVFMLIATSRLDSSLAVAKCVWPLELVLSRVCWAGSVRKMSGVSNYLHTKSSAPADPYNTQRGPVPHQLPRNLCLELHHHSPSSLRLRPGLLCKHLHCKYSTGSSRAAVWTHMEVDKP